MKTSSASLVVFVVTLSLGSSLPAVELPPEVLLWPDGPPGEAIPHDGEEKLRSHGTRSGSPSGSNRVYSNVSTAIYSIHRPDKPNGVGIVICPGGGFRDVWIDREGHDLAIRLKEHGVTSLVLKYRTRPAGGELTRDVWKKYLLAVEEDGRQAIRTLRTKAPELGLKPDKIGICGFSAGGYLAILCALHSEPKRPNPGVGGMPSFAGLFYPGVPDDIGSVIESRTKPESATAPICPLFIMNARVDKLTPAEKCVDFYAMLLKAGVNAELHVYNKGGHGFDLAVGRGKSTAMWPSSFVAWLEDTGMIEKSAESKQTEPRKTK